MAVYKGVRTQPSVTCVDSADTFPLIATACGGSVMCGSGDTVQSALGHLRGAQIAPSAESSFVSKVTTWSFSKHIKSIIFTSARADPNIMVSVYNDTASEVITFGDTVKCSGGVCTIKAPSTLQSGYIVVNGEIDATAGAKAQCVTLQNIVVKCAPSFSI